MLEQLSTNKRKYYKHILIALLILIGLLIFQGLHTYMSGFLGAAILYIMLKRQMVFLTEKKKLGKGFSAVLITLEALLFFLGPITGIAFLTVDTLSGIDIDPKAIMASINTFIDYIEEKMGYEIFTPENISVLPKIGGNILQTLGSGIYSLLINSFIALFVLYYMLLNHVSFDKMIKEVLPFREENKQILGTETTSIIKANAVGIPLLAIIQGIFAYFGYAFFEIDNALLYAILTAFSSIIPILGTMIVWVPISIGLLISGNVSYAIAMAAYGFIIIGGVDNVARFLLQKMLADIHPLITVFGVLIGIPMFGFLGIIFGPLILSLFILFFNMYRYEYIPGSTAKPTVTNNTVKKRNFKKIKIKRSKDNITS